MSASVYANPYTYRPPPPRIDYPSFLSGFNNITFRYALDSKILALGVLILGAGTFVVLVMTFMPFWFELQLSDTEGTFGSEPVMKGVTINTGLFYMREDKMDNIVFLDKYTNVDTVPHVIQAAQAFSIAGTCILVACFGASVILLCRRFASVTALVMLAGATTLAAVLHVLAIVCCAVLVVESSCEPSDSGCNYRTSNLKWHMIPMYSQIYRVEVTITPYVQASWGLYLAALGVVVCIGAAVIMWIEACMNMKNLRQIRYQQLKEHRDPYEKEADAFTGHKYVYQPPVQRGPDMYGMQPVFASTHHYEGMVIAPAPQPQAYIPPARFDPHPVRPPSPGAGRRYNSPPSVTSSTSGPSVPSAPAVREIDL